MDLMPHHLQVIPLLIREADLFRGPATCATNQDIWQETALLLLEVKMVEEMVLEELAQEEMEKGEDKTLSCFPGTLSSMCSCCKTAVQTTT